MQIDTDPLKVQEAHFPEPIKILMVENSMDTNEKAKEIWTLGGDEKIKVVYSKAEEELADFLNRCKLKDFEVMLYPYCSVVFDTEAVKDLESVRPQWPNNNT